MSHRRAKKLNLTHSEVTAVTKTTEFDITHPKPVRVIRWTAFNNKDYEIYLYSDNYPDLPSQRLKRLAALQKISIRICSPAWAYWYNHYPSLLPLVKTVSAALRTFAILTKGSYRYIRQRVVSCSVFFDWLIAEQENMTIPTSISDINKEILLSFRDYLYRDFSKDKLAEGKTNQKVWAHSVPGLIKFFTERPSYKLSNSSLSHLTFPKFHARQDRAASSTVPYSDFEMWEIIVAADNICSRYMHNWQVMRKIDDLRIGDWERLEDICWVIVNIEWQQPRHKRGMEARQYQVLRSKFGLSYKQFYERYSEAEIRQMATKGSCPFEQFMASTLESLPVPARQTYARAWLRRSLGLFFEARKTIISATGEPDWNSIFNTNRLVKIQVNSFCASMKSTTSREAFWEAAGLQRLHSLDIFYHSLISLFFPTVHVIYAFHLFVMAESGVNLEVVNSIDRNMSFSDLDPNNVVYRGIKTRTGKHNNRHEEIIVPRNEPQGIAERIEFVKEITEPFVKWRPEETPDNALWLGLTVRDSRNRRFVSLGNSMNHYRRANTDFCSDFGLLEVRYGEDGTWTDSEPLTYINSRRLRKTNVLKDMAQQLPYSAIQAALADNSFETVYRWYIDTNVQRQHNSKAIAAIQEVLIGRLKAYSRETVFTGEIVYDTPLMNATDISDNLLSACSSEITAGAQDSCCLPLRFDVCLGCQSSRVFREHLPSICFRISQYDEQKTKMATPDWEATYNIYRLRAIDCLKKYAKRGKSYSDHVDAAWVVAKTDGGVYLPPLT